MKFSGDKFEALNTNFYITIGRSAKVERPIFLNNLSYFLPQGTQSFYTKYTSIRLSQKSLNCTEESTTVITAIVTTIAARNVFIKYINLSQKSRKCTEEITTAITAIFHSDSSEKCFYKYINLSQKSRKCTENSIVIPCVHCALFVNLVVKSLSQKPRKCTDFFTQPLPGLASPCRRQPLCPLRVSPPLCTLCYLCGRCG